MALIKCSECGKEISDKAETCVHCGCPQEKQETESIEIAKLAKIQPKRKTHPLTKGCAVTCAIFLIVMVISYMAVYMGGVGSNDSRKPKKKIHSGLYKCVDGDGAVSYSTKKIPGLTCTPIMIEEPEPKPESEPKKSSQPSKAIVGNSPWDSSVYQVERYLKKT